MQRLGYKLQDCGSHWRTSAVYRSGKNQTAIIIYKDSGVWKDFGMDNQAKPFSALVKETLKTNDPKILGQYISSIPETNTREKIVEQKIEMEKIYPKSFLEKLLPIRTFYENKKISEKTQQTFSCGYAGSGKMYRRIVFPIFNLDGEIHGFSGRTVQKAEGNIPKWKHMGRKTDWIYPNHLIEVDREVIIVESIGDCLALHEAGYRNILVAFGLDASSKIISFLNSFNLERIVIAMNNDKEKEVNSGLLATIKTAAKLAQIYDLNQICINPPLANDFGDMLHNGISFTKWHKRNSKWSLADKKTQDWITKEIKENEVLFKSAICKKLIKILNS